MYSFDEAKHVRALILDVDGVLAPPQFLYNDQGEETKFFHVRDGLGIQLLFSAGIEVAIISGRQSKATEHRIKELGIKNAYFGQKQKLAAYEKIKQTLSLQDKEIAYMGDDLPDIPVLKRVGLPITLKDSPDIVKEHALWHIEEKAGFGAVRKAAEQILIAQKRYETVLQSYLST